MSLGSPRTWSRVMRSGWNRLALVSPLVMTASMVLGIAVCARQPVAPAQAATVQAPPPPSPASPSFSAPPGSFAPLVESVKAAVVNVSVTAQARPVALPDGFQSEMLERFFGVPGGRGRAPLRQGAGSGFIIDPSGLVLTNNHVVEGAKDIQVKLEDGRNFSARVLGRDPLTDLALLQLERGTQLPSVRLGDSDAMRVGDWVVAIGNPFGLASSVSAGIISARARDIRAGPYDDFLQTDAAINPGNSGGPLFNLRGEVIGINTAIIGGGTGIGFAVPANMAKLLLPQLQKGEVRRGWLGVSIQDLTAELAKGLGVPTEGGALVAQVNPDTPAAQAGLKEDDVIVEVNGQPIDSAKALTRAIGFQLPGERAQLGVWRGKDRKSFQVQLGERPDLEGVAARSSGPEAEPANQRLGLAVQDVPSGAHPSVRVVGVMPGSPADQAGLRSGMAILELNGQRIRSAQQLRELLEGAKAGQVVLMRVEVDGQRVLRALTIP